MSPYDNVEIAPSGRSLCRLCKKKITEGSPRGCIHEWGGRFYNKKYYHTKCLKSTPQGRAIWNRAKLSPDFLLQRGKAGNDLSRMDLLDLGAAQASDKSKKQKSVSERTLEERKELKQNLRQLRSKISHHFGYGDEVYKVFNNKTLDALVLDLPANNRELLKVYGFAQKRAESLGPFIFPIIREYQQNMTNGGNSSSTSNGAVAKSTSSKEEEDDEVIFESHESIEDVVNRLFKEAQERGEVITL